MRTKLILGSIFNSNSIKVYEEEVKMNLIKMGLNLNWLKNKHIMNIGTGRESIAFSNLGAKKVSHFDISEENILRFNIYKRE